MSGPELRGGSALAFTLVGSAGNVLVAVVLYLVARNTQFTAWGQLLREQSFSHAVWGIVQALPLIPFRAGTELARRLSPALRRSHAIISGTLAFGAIFAVFKLTASPLPVIVLVLVAISSGRAAHEAFQEELDQRSGLERQVNAARAALTAGNARHAAQLASAGLDMARSTSRRRQLWSTFTWASIAAGNPLTAHFGLQHLPEADIDLHVLSCYLSCCNRKPEAQRLLLDARAMGYRSPETGKHLIELLFAQGDREQALSIADSDVSVLSAEDRSLIVTALLTPAQDAC